MPNRKRRMGKEKAMPQILGCSADSDSNTVQQFELELQWCIQQLEAALATSKMAPKQAAGSGASGSPSLFSGFSSVSAWDAEGPGDCWSGVFIAEAQDAAYSLTILRSKRAPVIKKRQVMRSSFGDYRTKMAEEEKKLNKAQMRICIAAPAPNKKSCFVKRSAVICEPSQNNFRFNFDMSLDKERTSTNQPTTSHNNFVYKSSDNSFRFNFVQPAS